MRRAANRRDIAPTVVEGESHGCGGKRQYSTFTAANRLAKRQRQQLDTVVEAYACRHCHKFHIGARERDGLPRPLKPKSRPNPNQESTAMATKPKPKPRPKPGC